MRYSMIALALVGFELALLPGRVMKVAGRLAICVLPHLRLELSCLSLHVEIQAYRSSSRRRRRSTRRRCTAIGIRLLGCPLIAVSVRLTLLPSGSFGVSICLLLRLGCSRWRVLCRAESL